MLKLLIKSASVELLSTSAIIMYSSQYRFFSNSKSLNAFKFTKTPTNRGKKFAPITVSVTKANQHLEVNLFDEKDVDLGRLSMAEAKKQAESRQFKLVITDESCSPPKFKLMSGQELYKLQMKFKEAESDSKENKVLKEKEIDFNLGISDHDFEIKLKMISNFYEKGHPIKINIISKIAHKEVKLICLYHFWVLS